MPTGIARRFASDEAQKPLPTTSAGAPVEARRAASSIRKHRGDAAPTTLKAPDLGKSTAPVVKTVVDKIKRKVDKIAKSGRPSTTGKPWIAAGISRQAWYKRKAKAKR
jgi:hypothetical protein